MKISSIIKAILIPIGLFLIAGACYTLLGPKNIEGIFKTMSDFWLFATIIRVLIYMVISTVGLRLIADRSNHNAQIQINRFNQILHEPCSDEEKAAMQNEVIHYEKRQIGYSKLRQRKFTIFTFLMLIEVIFVQLPFLIKP